MWLVVRSSPRCGGCNTVSPITYVSVSGRHGNLVRYHQRAAGWGGRTVRVLSYTTRGYALRAVPRTGYTVRTNIYHCILYTWLLGTLGGQTYITVYYIHDYWVHWEDKHISLYIIYKITEYTGRTNIYHCILYTWLLSTLGGQTYITAYYIHDYWVHWEDKHISLHIISGARLLNTLYGQKYIITA